MSRYLISAAVAALLLASSSASALELDGRVGYAASWSTGVSSLGLGEGLALGHTFRSGLHLEIVGIHFEGQRESAGNGAITYVASYQSIATEAVVAFDIRIWKLTLRPGIESGFSFVSGHTKLGAATVHDDVTRWMIGPSLAFFATLGRFHVGVVSEAGFEPSDVAAPPIGIYGMLGAEL